MKFMSFVLVLLVTNALAGCMQVNDLDDGLSAETESALVGSNALLTNSIDLNGLLSNSIDLNGIDPEMLSPTVLTSLRDSGQIGENTRLLYSYLVGCALDPSQSISFSWTDSFNVVHYERYWGAMGLAPTWKYTSITPSTRRSVSACLGARANYYGYTSSFRCADRNRRSRISAPKNVLHFRWRRACSGVTSSMARRSSTLVTRVRTLPIHARSIASALAGTSIRTERHRSAHISRFAAIAIRYAIPPHRMTPITLVAPTRRLDRQTM